ncbi:MAG TPA: hypothetical protein PLY87_23155 [Planctomycetaceae bacterium]|nr:hypothetical protein [Planctomycetaceae bacterium]
MNHNPTPPILSLVQKGSDQFPRYIIVKGDAFRNPAYWNAESEEWHSDEEKATVFADVNQVLWAHHRLMMESIGDLPCHKYTVALSVELYGQKPDLKQFGEWLEKAVRIVLNSPDYGYGPDGTVGVVRADFKKLKETK